MKYIIELSGQDLNLINDSIRLRLEAAEEGDDASCKFWATKWRDLLKRIEKKRLNYNETSPMDLKVIHKSTNLLVTEDLVIRWRFDHAKGENIKLDHHDKTLLEAYPPTLCRPKT